MDKRITKFIQFALPPLVPLVLVSCALEFLVKNNFIPSFLIPAPSDIARSLVEDRGELFEAFLSTGLAALVGLLMSFVFGTLTAALLSSATWLRRSIYPYAIFFQTVPIIAIAPVLVIWFGFGRPTVIASAFVVSVFPVIASTLLGLDSTDPLLADLFSLYSASNRDRFFKLKIPFSLPHIFSGLRIASGLAVIGAIVGEFVGGGGLGAVVDVARTQQRIDKVFAAVLISAFLGLVFVALINSIGYWFLRNWHVSARKP
jgi:NitT/TauT family transport system permease protein